MGNLIICFNIFYFFVKTIFLEVYITKIRWWQQWIIAFPGRRFRLSDPAGSCRKDAGKSPDPAGKHRKSLEHGSSIPTGNCPDFSGGFLSTFCAFRQEPARNHRKKFENFPAGILLTQNHRNYSEPAVSGQGSSTWVV